MVKLFAYSRAAVNATLGLSCLALFDAVRPQLLFVIAVYLSIDGLFGIGLVRALASNKSQQWTVTQMSFETSARLALAVLIFFNLAFHNSSFQIAMMNFVVIIVCASCGLAGLLYSIAGLMLQKFSSTVKITSPIDLLGMLMSTLSLLLGLFLISNHEGRDAVRLIGLYAFLVGGLFTLLGASTPSLPNQLRNALTADLSKFP